MAVLGEGYTAEKLHDDKERYYNYIREARW
jgi:hypothetical protein